MEKLVIIQKIFSSYRKPLFDLIDKRTDFQFLYGENNSGIKTAQASYAKSICSLQYGKKDTKVLLFPVKEILKIKPDIIICELAMGILNLPVIIYLCKIFNIKIAFWSHGYNRKTGFNPEKRLIDKYRLYLMRLVDANIVYSQQDRKLMEKYLENPVFVAQNTLDTNALSRIYKRLREEGKEAVKFRLGINHEFNIVFIGRMLASKRPEVLVEIHDKLVKDYGVKIGVHFIGFGEMQAKVKELALQNEYPEDFYFYGAIHDDEKSGEILYTSDLMVNPGGLGLSVNHAFCFDCPVISFKENTWAMAHGPEVEYVVNKKTGFLIKGHHIDDMVESIYEYLQQQELRIELQKNIRFYVEHVFPIEKMVDGVMDCVEYLEKNDH